MNMRTRFTTQIQHAFENVPTDKNSNCYLVYYDGGPSSVAALREACETAGPKTRVIAVFLESVTPSPEADGTLPEPSMASKAILAAATVNARVYGSRSETLTLPCQIKAPALVKLAAERGNATLFLGVDEPELHAHLNPLADY